MINKYLKVIAKNAKKFVANINSFAKNHPRLYWLSLIILLGLVYYPYILTGSKIAFVNGDFDYFLQNYEAIRKTILEYHQFPWWNPWSGGGLPLYANPQIGVFSVPTVMALIFGTAFGLKLTVLVFMSVGLFGTYKLFTKYVGISSFYATLLSFIWIFNGFFMARFPSHFSFIYFFYMFSCRSLRKIGGGGCGMPDYGLSAY